MKSLILFAGLFVFTKALVAAPLLQADFESEPVQADWTSFGNGRLGSNLIWSDQSPFSGNHCLLAASQRPREGIIGWESPPFKVEEGKIYRLTFASRAERPAYWQVTFQDANGATVEGDHNSQIAASEGWTTNESFFRRKYPGVTATVSFYTAGGNPHLAIDDVKVEEATPADALAAADRRWSEMAKPKDSPSGNPGDSLRQSLRKLRGGGPFRIVLFGDSIANDLSNSSLPLLLERAFPGSKIDVRFTGRGGTSWLKHQLQIEQRILRHQPDLLILLAISNDDQWLESPLNRIIDACRKDSPHTGILLVTPHLQTWLSQKDQGLRQRERILEIGARQKVDVFDLQSVWSQYLEATGKPLNELLRDSLHMNEFGRELSARSLVDYLNSGQKENPAP